MKQNLKEWLYLKSNVPPFKKTNRYTVCTTHLYLSIKNFFQCSFLFASVQFVHLCFLISSFLNIKEFSNIKSVRFNREFDSSHNFANSNIFQTRFSHFVSEKENSEFFGRKGNSENKRSQLDYKCLGKKRVLWNRLSVFALQGCLETTMDITSTCQFSLTERDFLKDHLIFAQR